MHGQQVQHVYVGARAHLMLLFAHASICPKLRPPAPMLPAGLLHARGGPVHQDGPAVWVGAGHDVCARVCGLRVLHCQTGTWQHWPTSSGELALRAGHNQLRTCGQAGGPGVAVHGWCTGACTPHCPPRSLVSVKSLHPPLQGYTLFASAFIGGPLTGAALNPARVFGPALCYNCYWNTAFIYIIAEYLGGAVAAVLALMLYGPGPEHEGGHEADPLATQELARQGGSSNKQGERTGLINVAASSSGGQPQPGNWAPRF